ncbi:DUF7284 family protein [Halogeometricum limi]|uniref:DUF7284 family protein n=1 Tax=Halogeometricum limi TaxID=555875 RepID=UPI001FE104A0|nr:hypothetical protein [Halogeometricum limi]
MNATVDAAVFFLLLGAAVVGLTTADVGAQTGVVDDGRADAVATVLATSTATVNYSLAPGARAANQRGAAFERTDGPEFERTVHGSLAGHLSRVTLGTAAFDDRPVTHARDGLRNATRRALTAELSTVGLRIDAVWRPYPDASVESRVSVGERPPASAATDAATVSIPVGVEPLSPNETDDFETLSEAVAARTVEALAPAGRMRVALRDDAPVSTLAAYRYDRLGEELGVSVSESVEDADTTTANRRLAAALSPRVESDLRTQYDSSEDAAAAVSVAEVRIVVRTWATEGR